jgi:hypothetical protein
VRNTAQYNDLSNISFKIVILCKYAVLTVTLKVFETFLKAIFGKSFQVFRRILIDVGGITKRRSFNADFG